MPTTTVQPAAKNDREDHAEVDQKMIVPPWFKMRELVLDTEIPYAIIAPHDAKPDDKTVQQRVDVPTAVAFYLTTHKLGSESWQEFITGRTRVKLAEELLALMREIPKIAEKLGWKDLQVPRMSPFPEDHPAHVQPYSPYASDLSVPANHRVSGGFNCDDAIPTMRISPKGSHEVSDDKTTPIPPAMAHYLATRGPGSRASHEKIQERALRDMVNEINAALGLEPKS